MLYIDQSSLATAGRHLLCMLAITATCFIAFSPSLKHSFAWDDHALILENSNLAGDSVGKTFLRPFWNTPDKLNIGSRKFYRPMVILSYKADHAVYGYSPHGYHFTNILLHSACAVLLYFVALSLLRNQLYAILAALLFAIHPVHVENVSWISGRTDLICALFLLPAFYFFHQHFQRKDRPLTLLLMSGLLYFLALLAKETAISFIFIISAYLLAFHLKNISWKQMITPMLIISGITAGYALIRIITLGAFGSVADYGTWLERIISIPKAFTLYLGLLLNSLGMDPHHSYGLASLDSPSMLIPYFCIPLIYILAGWITFKRSHWLTLFLLLWIPASLAPVFNFGTFGDVMIADRFLYIPSAGFCILAVKALQLASNPLIPAGWRVKPILAVVVTLFITSLLMVTLRYQLVWSNDTALFTYAVNKSPKSSYIQFNLGLSMARNHNYTGALQHFRKAIELDPMAKESMTNLGVTMNNIGMYKEALFYLNKAVQTGDRSSLPYLAMGEAYRNLGDMTNAIKHYRLSLNIAETPTAINNIGEALIAIDRPDEAVKEFTKLLESGEKAFVLNNLGLAWYEAGGYLESRKALERALRIIDKRTEPQTYCMICYNLARVHKAMGDSAKAQSFAKQAIQIAEQALPPEQYRALADRINALIIK